MRGGVSGPEVTGTPDPTRKDIYNVGPREASSITGLTPVSGGEGNGKWACGSCDHLFYTGTHLRFTRSTGCCRHLYVDRKMVDHPLRRARYNIAADLTSAQTGSGV